MFRARIELLEKRKMFSVTDLILDPFNAVVAAPVEAATIVGFIDEVETSEPTSLGKMHLEDISLGIVAHYAGDHGDYLAAESLSLNFARIDWEVIARRPETAEVSVLAARQDLNDLYLALSRTETVGNDENISMGAVVQRFLLPYMEQDNVYQIADITDGTSNTMMFIARTHNGQVLGDLHVNEKDVTSGIIAILIGLSADPSDTSENTAGPNLGAVVDTSPIELSSAVASIDVWEHAYLVQPGNSTSGIIAVLIGLTVDPSDASGNTVYAANSGMAHGSARFLGTDVSGRAFLFASDEFFSPFANTTLDDEALVATTYGRGGAAAQITHDVEFENWASVSQFDRGTLSLGFNDLLVSSVRAGGDGNRVVGSDHAWSNHVQSILHEENEFSFPRMNAAGDNVMAEWTRDRG